MNLDKILSVSKELMIYEAENGKNKVFPIQNLILIYNYSNIEFFPSRSMAEKFYLECMQMSEGSERERYTSIYTDLESGYNFAIDDYEYFEKYENGQIKCKFDSEKELKKFIKKAFSDSNIIPTFLDNFEIKNLYLKELMNEDKIIEEEEYEDEI